MTKTALATILTLTVTLAAGMPYRAGAEQRHEIAPVSIIDRLMVYHDRALVTRRVPCGTLTPGVYEITVENMPSLLFDESVRARVTAGEVKILDVEVRTSQLERSPEKLIHDEMEKLQELEDRRQSINGRIAVLKRAAEFLDSSGESFLGVPRTGPQGVRPLGLQYKNRIAIDDYDRMLAYLMRKQQENTTALHAEEKNLRAVDRTITVQREKLAKVQGSIQGLTRKKFIKITAEVLKGGTVAMEVSYINQQITWKPGYDIRVFLDEKKTDFTGYGIVSQSSGEDWKNAQISFSTAQPAVRGFVPELIPVYATLASKIPQKSAPSGRGISQQQMNRSILDNVAREESAGTPKNDDAVIDSAPERAASRAGSLVFPVPKRVDIPADGSPHRTPISRSSLPVKFEYLCVPKLNPMAFLMAVGSNTLETPILRGDLNIFLGNDFVGSSYTDSILPGQYFELMLSVNENIRVTRSLEEKEEQEAGFLGSTKKINYQFLIKIENYSGGDIVMNVFDQLPVSRTSEIEIKNVAFSHEPQVRDKKGICKWQFAMKSKEVIKLTFAFTIAVPKNQDAAFFRTNLSPSLYLEQLIRSPRADFEADEYRKQERAPALRMKKY